MNIIKLDNLTLYLNLLHGIISISFIIIGNKLKKLLIYNKIIKSFLYI
jgi:hypothetical protein